MPDAVLLTGATGFVGRQLLAALCAARIPVHAVSRRPGAPMPGVTWHRADLLVAEDRAEVAGLAPRLIHCAWEVEHGAFWTAPANALWREASADLVGRFMAASGVRVVALGTCAEYDAAVPGTWDEARAIAPATPYGQAKAALHAELAAICGDALVWARLFHLYGPNEDPRRLIPGLIAACRAGRPAEVRAAELIRDVASTPHVARLLVALMDSPLSGPCDIGSGQPRSLGALARIVAETAGRPDLLSLAHAPGPGDPPVMAPRLDRLRRMVAQATETPETALRAHVMAELARQD
ncbi:NAD-dependent epimerase/dehydratase family protein [Roseicyclus mahoneyensis]|uniref:Nucleoside-diphosphate-sugar epimerase n=1 Tax=Roseicyclus mahoneyensis TaxID=164332 RepID=A0A316GG35_9RHOB|nr:NAD(P)-dependent oxidoreductase [Roseicyclus mahoneyensis]PWK59605.1 nucleoside-diphosphate-sugar epimerase [Roseicyclus mahoneyensis]